MEERVGNLPYLKTHVLATSVLNLSQNIQPSWLVDTVGRAVLLQLTGVTWKTGGTTKTSIKLGKKGPLKMSIKWLWDLKEDNGSKFIRM
jgi:2-iminoacetate synthase ThiH